MAQRVSALNSKGDLHARGIAKVIKRPLPRSSPSWVRKLQLIDLTDDDMEIRDSIEQGPSYDLLPWPGTNLDLTTVDLTTPLCSAFRRSEDSLSSSSTETLPNANEFEIIDLTNDVSEEISDDELTDLSVEDLTERFATIQPCGTYEEHRQFPPSLTDNWHEAQSDVEVDQNDLEYLPGQSVELINGDFLYIERVSQFYYGRYLKSAKNVDDHIGIPDVHGELIWMAHERDRVSIDEIKGLCPVRFSNDRRAHWTDRADYICRLKLTISARRIIHNPRSRQTIPESNREYAIEYLTFEEVRDACCRARTGKELRETWRGHGETIPFGAKESSAQFIPLSIDLDSPATEILDLDEIRNRKYTFGDAYCGAGGASCGAQQAGLEMTWAVDKDFSAISTYRANFPHSLAEHSEFNDFMTNRAEDVRVDVCHTSPPCQPFSPAHTVNNQERDEMNSACIFTSHDLISKARPRILTMEETFGLKGRHKIILHRILMDFVEIGYSVRWAVVDCVNYGVPQMRRRLIIIAAGPGEKLPNLPKPTHGPPESFLRPFETIGSAIDDIPDDAMDHDTAAFLERSRNAFREEYSSDRPAHTLTCSGGAANYHPSGKRAFTIRESACIQTFPMNFEFCGSGKRKQIGNAVPPRFAKAVYREVCQSLRETDEKELTE
ncbi:hypothetical protein N7456_006597 [Penicillium angulare]|uniref:DNA (cytosine-5-)-methyltransferase n=1 Tax=Penicillium angulare TaxID=116970 RepID=A0A9W9KBT4_9EURO|nr:hypothetical protein N7456_006597 [Penicillium angulare]